MKPAKDTLDWQEEAPYDLDLDSVPTDWSNFTRAAKVQRLLDVIQHQIMRVRAGSFNPTKGEKVAAIALEAQIELAEFYADAESSAKNAKHLAEYADAEAAIEYAKQASSKITESALKRMSSVSVKVKEANKSLCDLEKEHKKWRYVYETLKEAHIFFRNIGKL